jgi:hypothetical protein
LPTLLADGLLLQRVVENMVKLPPWALEFQKGTNFRGYPLSIDVGKVEAWTTMVIWEDGELIITTQYEPPFMCDMEPCLHLPQRCHWDMLVQNLEELIT